MRNYVLSILKHGLVLIILLILAYVASWVFYLWIGYPAGGDDAIQHVYRLTTIARFFPNHAWLHTWAGGMPHFVIYPTLPYLPVVLLMKVTSWDPYLTIFISGIFAFGCLAFSVYFMSYRLSRHVLLSFLAAILVLFNFGTWQVLMKAVFVRVWAAPFMVLSWASLFGFLKIKQEGGKGATKWLVVTALFLGLTFSLHLFMGIMAAVIIFLFIIFVLGISKQSIISLTKLGLATFSLASAIILPILFLKPPGIWVGKDVSDILYRVDRWSLFAYWHDPKTIYPGKNFSIAFYYPVLAGLALVIFLFLVYKRKISLFYSKLLAGFLLISIGFFIYAAFPFKALGFFYNQFLPNFWALSYLPIFLSGFIFVVLWLWLKKRSLGLNILTIVLIVASFTAVYFQYDPFNTEAFLKTKGKKQINISPEVVKGQGMREQFDLDENAFNFRFGDGNYGKVSVWFNALFPFVPQTRDFFPPGIVNTDSYFYLIQAGWFEKENYAETNFLFDWWAVKEFVVKKLDEDVGDKFVQRPDDYEAREEVIFRETISYDVYRYKKATPIISSSDAPAVLVIGRQPEAYNTVFGSLAYGNFNSQFVIPVEGVEFIDDYDLDELKMFPIIFLYHSYRWHNFDKAEKLLGDYVSDGGRLVIEANRDLEDNAHLPEIYPIKTARKVDIEGWELDGSSWGGMATSELKENSTSVIDQEEGSVLVKGVHGMGEVVWSGMNLPFYITYRHDAEKSKLLAELLGVENQNDHIDEGVFISNNKGGLIHETSQAKVEFVHPEKRIIELKKSSSGILFKESYFPNWIAKLNGKRVKIYKAGPGFIYVPLTGSEIGDKVTFIFSTHPVQWAGKIISLGTFSLMMLYLFKPKVFGILIKPFRGVKEKIFSWWQSEDS